MSRPRVSRLGAAAAALFTTVGAACLLSFGAVAHADVTIAISPAVVHADSVIVVSGAKSSESTVTVDLRPPGNQRQVLTCTGADAGSTAWSCSVPGSAERPFGSFEVRATEVDGDSTTVATTRFQVVPDAVGSHPAPPPPSPSPTPTATQTPPPSPKPTAGPPPGKPPVTIVAIPTPEPTDIQLDTEPLPDEPVAAPGVPRTVVAHYNPPADPSVLDGALPTLAELVKYPLTLVAAGGIGALILLLIAIPANILDATIEANYERIKRPFARFAIQIERLKALRNRLPHTGISAPLVIVLASVAFGFTDPEFGANVGSLRLTLALALGLLIVVLVPILITRIAMRARWDVTSEVVARPGAFVLALIGVLASRTIGFSPGILIGLVLGLELARNVRKEARARATVIRIVSTLVIAVLAWFAYSWFLSVYAGSEPTFGSQLTIETMAAAASEGLSGIMVAVLPITFMEGKDLFDENRRTWIAVAIPTAFAFSLLVLPTVVTEDGPESPIGLWIAVLVGFSLIVAAIWLTFRILNARDSDGGPDAVRAREAEESERSVTTR